MYSPQHPATKAQQPTTYSEKSPSGKNEVKVSLSCTAGQVVQTSISYTSNAASRVGEISFRARKNDLPSLGP
ncbi:hypothetical protein ACN47E_007424 [Coniothyrium glycines]